MPWQIPERPHRWLAHRQPPKPAKSRWDKPGPTPPSTGPHKPSSISRQPACPAPPAPAPPAPPRSPPSLRQGQGWGQRRIAPRVASRHSPTGEVVSVPSRHTSSPAPPDRPASTASRTQRPGGVRRRHRHAAARSLARAELEHGQHERAAKEARPLSRAAPGRHSPQHPAPARRSDAWFWHGANPLVWRAGP